MEAAKTIVIENGSSTIKAGFAGEDEPQTVFPNTVANYKPISQFYKPLISLGDRPEIIGEVSHHLIRYYDFRPISEGIVECWHNMEKIWQHTFYNKLGQAPEEAIGVVLTEVIRNPNECREKMVEMMFEHFQVQNVYVALDSVMALYATGRTTGLVCDIGEDFTRSVPVFEGFTIPHAVEKSQIGGRALTDCMQKLLFSERTNPIFTSELQCVIDIKEKFSLVAQDNDFMFATAKDCSKHDKEYKMPDGEMITIPANVRMQCPELLFESRKSLQTLSYASVRASDNEVRNELCKNIILNGATTMIEGLADRFKKEIEKLAPSVAEINVIAPTERKNAVWRGASIYASQSDFQKSWVTVEEFQENGARIIHRKCH